MLIQEKNVTLKSGQLCLLRSPVGSDAAQILEHLKLTSAETDFMARYEDEIRLTPEAERAYLDKLAQDERSFMISAFILGELAANAGVNMVAPYERYRHRGEFGISIKRKFWGMGIGSAIIAETIAVSRSLGYEQLDLEVVSTNTRAIALYERFGFTVFGKQEHSLKYRDGSYAAQLLMMLEL